MEGTFTNLLLWMSVNVARIGYLKGPKFTQLKIKASNLFIVKESIVCMNTVHPEQLILGMLKYFK